ncbi:hypothetical protein FIBSPDRAFT_796348 [Athelia psychrophila]|uniref:Dipeptidase n=1 Tax=Athelia psychrophila TaxID=1759441 RepID=A0A166DIS3_9AGAM|nr:hypothetical protein FIBSPDRAFT_796348 [Fibularhizoctonia sp. CBS 109695]
MPTDNDSVDNLISSTIAVIVAAESTPDRPPPTFEEEVKAREHALHVARIRAAVWGVLTILFVVGLGLVFGLKEKTAEWGLSGELPRNKWKAAGKVLDMAPVIDGHIDLPILARMGFANNVSAIDLEHRMVGQVDIPRLRQGKVGGFFWSVYVGCVPNDQDPDFLDATWQVRDTIEQVDVSKNLIEKYPDTFQLAMSTNDIYSAITSGKIASLLGIEGAHSLGNSIAVLRQFYALGVRYLTLTHGCHNAFADSSGDPTPRHSGLSPLGYALVDEMNRLGMLVDVSHTSDLTAAQVLKYSKAPVIFSHSSARSVHDHPRNVPDDVLELIGDGEGQQDAVVMVNFVTDFIARPGMADVHVVANHIEHIARVAGKKHVGLGSDYDGMQDAPAGLEDASKYPALIAELYARGWTRLELAGLTGANLLRVFTGAERVSAELKKAGAQPVYDLYAARRDLPREKFPSVQGGGGLVVQADEL